MLIKTKPNTKANSGEKKQNPLQALEILGSHCQKKY